jgi:streptogramin lyase
MRARWWAWPIVACELLASGAEAQGPAFLLQFGGPGSAPGQFLLSHHLTVTPQGDVYLADINNHRVQRFDASGAFVSQWGLPTEASGVAVAPDGSLYACGGDFVWHLDPNGGYLDAWAAPGAATASSSGHSMSASMPMDSSMLPTGEIIASRSSRLRARS